MTIRRTWQKLLAAFSYPAEPDLISYDDLIKALNRRRSRVDLPRVAEWKRPEKPFRPQPYVVVSTYSTACSSGVYDYEPPDDFGLEEPRGYRP